MERSAWLTADSIVSPLGATTSQNFDAMMQGLSGIREVTHSAISNQIIYASSIQSSLESPVNSRFEELCLKSQRHLNHITFPREKTLFILSTTKGNIDQIELEDSKRKRFHLYEVAEFLSDHLGIQNYKVVSTACVSGTFALIYAQRMIAAGRYDHVVITGADILSDFVMSGFRALNAISAQPCRPFDHERTGINLGEAAATVVISALPQELGLNSDVRIVGCATSNDANHISGPSRTGKELAQAIEKSMNEANILPTDIDMISAHGTGTIYNDEMEANAYHLVGLNDAPVNSLKAYFGHTLGAAGVVECILTAESLKRNQLIRSKGFHASGTTHALNMITENEERKMTTALKTASGFGGSNAVLILQKVE